MRNQHLWIAVATSSLLGCLADLEEEPALDETEQHAFVDKATLWPDASNIPVCWMTPGFTTEKAWVRTQLEASWEAVSRANFTGWNNCSSSTSKGVRIAIADGQPHSQFGTNATRVTGASMVLNFTYGTWNTSCATNKQWCIRADAVHEFGHALGFLHEQDRADTPSWCDEQTGTSGSTVGAWDVNSVMNYCNPQWNNWGRLSDGDVAAARKIYGNSGAVYPLLSFAPDYALSGAGLIRGESLTSRNGRFRAVMQHDGNLVVYTGGTVLWHSNTYNTNAYSLIVQGDGNLVMYDFNGTPRWYTGTQGAGFNVQLTMQDDGNLVLYRRSNWTPLWSSGTGGHELAALIAARRRARREHTSSAATR